MCGLNEWPTGLIKQIFVHLRKGATGKKFQRSENYKKKKKESWIEAPGNRERADQRRNRILRASPIDRKWRHLQKGGQCVRWVEVRFFRCCEAPWPSLHSLPPVRAFISGIPAPLWCDELGHVASSRSLSWERGLVLSPVLRVLSLASGKICPA